MTDQVSAPLAPPEEVIRWCVYCGAECNPPNEYGMCDACRYEESREWLLEHNGW